MNDSAMTTARAEELAREDFQTIRTIIGNVETMALDFDNYGRSLVVDGSRYSPSWRALSGGARLWDLTAPGQPRYPHCIEAYEETFDRLTDDWSGPNGEYLFWDEGCLFVGIGEQND